MIVTFSPVDQRQCLVIPILEDTVSENPETFEALLSSDDPDVSSTIPMATVTITDEDRVTVGLEMEVYPTSEDDGGVEVCANVSGGQLDREIVVTLTTNPGSADGKDD